MNKKFISWTLILLFCNLLFASCATKEGYLGTAIGTLGGGLVGALADKKNPFRGAIIGAGAGALVGGTIGELSARAKKEAAESGKTVVYANQQGERVEAIPVASNQSNQNTKCKKVQNRIWKNGQVISDTIEEICSGEKTTNEY